MRFRTTLIAALLLALFGVYYYFFEHRQARQKEEAREKEKQVFSLDWDRLRGIRVVGSHGAFLLERQPGEAGEKTPPSPPQGEWRLVEPIKAEADSSLLSGMVDGLKGLKIDQVVAENPEDLAPFGLESPKMTIEVRMTEGEPQPPALRVGGKSPVGANSYARREGEDKVLLLSASLETQFDKSLFDLREKRLFLFNQSEVESLRILKQGRPWLEMAREDGQWLLISPLRAPADEEEVGKILSKLTGLRARSFEAEEGADLASFGLADPAWTVEVGLSPDHARVSLVIGSAGRDEGRETVFAKRGETPGVVNLDRDVTEALAAGPEQLREKKVFAFKSWEVEKVELDLEGTSVALEKTDEGKWWIRSPIEARAAAARISPFLSSLSRLEGQEFIPAPEEGNGLAAYGLDAPIARITLLSKGEKSGESAAEPQTASLGTLLLGRSAGEEGLFYAMRQGADTVARVGKEFFDQELPRSLDDLRDRKLLDFYRYQVEGIEAEGAPGRVVLARRAGTWRLEKPEDRGLEEKEVDDLLGRLTDLEVVRFVGPGGEGADQRAAGLTPPDMKITLKGEKGVVLGTLLVSGKGPEGDPGRVYAAREGENWVGLIEKAGKQELTDGLRPFLSTRVDSP